MPLVPISFRPGINTQKPLLANEGGWSFSNLIRFKDGLPQSIGGWVAWLARPLEALARIILSWSDLNGSVRTAIGLSDDHLIIVNGTTILDITPTQRTDDVAIDFSTTSGSATITIVDSEGSIPGRSVNIVTPVAVGGLILQGIYEIDSYVGGGEFTITSPTQASSTVADGGAVPQFTTVSGSTHITVTLANHGYVIADTFVVQIETAVGGLIIQGAFLVESVTDTDNFVINSGQYATQSTSIYLNAGNARLTYYTGTSGNYSAGEYGIGGYGLGAYGEGGDPGPTGTSAISAPLWTLLNWGETLLLCPGDAPIFSWSPDTGQTQPNVVTNAPSICAGIFLAMPQLTVVAWGSSIDGSQDPLLLSWSTAGDYTDWIPTVTNQAGSYHLPSGSRIVAGIQAPQTALIFTDVDLYAMNYLGGQSAEFAWGFIKIADKCGLIAPRAVGVLGQMVYWLSPGQFMVFAGGVQPLPCTVWDEFWQDLDRSNVDKVFIATNQEFHEVAWFYPSISGNTGECDSYVKYNTVEHVWDYGKLKRTAWQDYSAIGMPIAGGTDKYIYQHETGTDANGTSLDWSLESAGVMISEGDEMMFVDWLLPEFQYGFKNQSNTNEAVKMTVNAYRYTTESSPIQTVTKNFTATGDGFKTVRLRGRHMTFAFSGSGFTRIGKVRYRGARDGKY